MRKCNNCEKLCHSRTKSKLCRDCGLKQRYKNLYEKSNSKETKCCKKCKVEYLKTIEFFPPHKRTIDNLDSWCRSCRRKYRKIWRNPPDNANRDEWAKAQQLKECIICGATQKLVVDHNHSNGLVRGALCQNCNLGLGHFKDDPERLRLAALYIEGVCACGECQVIWGGNASTRKALALRKWDC